jgi:hypothetical protein
LRENPNATHFAIFFVQGTDPLYWNGAEFIVQRPAIFLRETLEGQFPMAATYKLNNYLNELDSDLNVLPYLESNGKIVPILN